MDIHAICEGVVTLSCTYLGKEGGIKVTLDDFKRKYKLGKAGTIVTEKDIQKLVKKLIYYNGGDNIPIFDCDSKGIHVFWG